MGIAELIQPSTAARQELLITPVACPMPDRSKPALRTFRQIFGANRAWIAAGRPRPGQWSSPCTGELKKNDLCNTK